MILNIAFAFLNLPSAAKRAYFLGKQFELLSFISQLAVKKKPKFGQKSRLANL
jgi:hypothetical protein